MYLIRPMTVDDAALSSTNVAEPYTGETAWSSTATYAAGDQAIRTSTHRIYERVDASVQSTVTMTIASPCVVSWTAHGLSNGDPVAFSTTGALPTGLTAGTVYYVVAAAADTFEVAATSGGTAINTSGSQSGTHTAHAANPDPATDNGTHWTDIGPTDAWAMFDTKVGTQTQNADSIAVELALNTTVNALALLNIDGGSAQVTMTDSVDGVVYDRTTSLIDLSGITDCYSWCFDPIAKLTTLVLNDLPAYGATATLAVTLTNTGSTAKCGACIPGLSKTIGDALYGAQLGIQDYSLKSTDDFGNYTIVVRPFADTGSFDVRVKSTFVDQLKKLLSDYRATPIVYVGSDQYSSTVVFGFYKDFRITIDYPDYSLCNIEVEGLT